MNHSFPLGSIALFTIILIICNNHPPLAYAETKEENQVTIWNDDTCGPITSFRYNSNNRFTGTRVVGSADGAGNIYIDSYHIAPNQTLIIEPGVTVHFDGYSANQFAVYGTLRAIGTASEPIVFKPNGTQGSWDGITARNGNVIMEHCIVQNGSIHGWRSNVTMESCDITSSIGIHLFCKKLSPTDTVLNTAILRNNTVREPRPGETPTDGFSAAGFRKTVAVGNRIIGDGALFQASGYSLECRDNRVTNGFDFHIGNKGDEEATVSGNVLVNTMFSCYGNMSITDNYVYNPNGTALELYLQHNRYEIHNNVLVGNISMAGDFQDHRVNAEYNYWGTVDREEINRTMHRNDMYNGFEVEVDFEPYLGEDGEEYTGPDGGPGPDGRFFYATLAGMAALLVILLAVAAVVFMRRRRARTVEAVEVVEAEAVEVVEAEAGEVVEAVDVGGGE